MSTNTDTSISRGNQTRDQLIEAALYVFGRDGYHAARTRTIAQKAGVNQSMIGYHFGGKQGLYLALFEVVAAKTGELLGPMVVQVEQALEHEIPQSDSPRMKAVDLIEALLFSVVDSYSTDKSSVWSSLVIREQLDPTPAFEILYKGYYGQLLELLTKLVMVAEPSFGSAEAARSCAFNLFGQVMIYRCAPATLDNLLGWSELDDSELDVIKQQVRLNVRSLFGRSQD